MIWYNNLILKMERFWGEILVVPNVALPMLMMVQFLVCRSVHKQEEAAALAAKKLKKKK